MRSKIISFIIGGMIGFCLWSIQVNASPIGYEAIQKQEIADPEEYMEENRIDITLEVEETCEKYGKEYNICPEILQAIAWKESRCKPRVSNGDCKGLMQVNAKIHQGRMKKLGVKDIYDVDGNIHTAADLLSELYKDKKNISKAIDAYSGNTGSSKYAKQVLLIAKCLDMTGGE